MRVIPVIDLLDGHAVHAIHGDREHYQPVRSVLSDTADPSAIARSFRDKLGLNEIYVADLNAIQGSITSIHSEVIVDLACREKIDILLDAGVSDVENARAWLDKGVRKIVIGSETLQTWEALRDIPAKIDQDRLVFSLDSRDCKILSQCLELASRPFMEVLGCLQSAGWREVLLLDIGRVGSGQGVDRALLAAAQANFPGLHILVGGGIAGPAELAELAPLGIAGVLVATALHRGTITGRHLCGLDRELV
jgi:phosphoribosylformimino-5-aminoimidazole carboxamide ribotide isomerase